MPPVQQAMDLLLAGLGALPAVLVVVALLAGPTLVYVVWVNVGERREGQRARIALVAVPVRAEYWQCPDCLSLTPMTEGACYRCDFTPGLDDVEPEPPETLQGPNPGPIWTTLEGSAFPAPVRRAPREAPVPERPTITRPRRAVMVGDRVSADRRRKRDGRPQSP